MISMNVRFNRAELEKAMLAEADRESRLEAEAAARDLAAATPEDTGFAATHWTVVPLGLGKGYAIRNPADYLRQLNQGSSQQAGARFIERIMLRYGRLTGRTLE